MAITKTDFLEFSRCPRYAALEDIKKEKLDADISYEKYKESEKEQEILELYSSMIESDEEGNLFDKTNEVNKQLEAMMPYYKIVEQEAGRLATKQFGGTSIYALKTNDQVSFDFCEKGVRFLCYVDIYNETSDKIINIIEVKATTSKKYIELQGGYKKQPKFSIFKKKDNIYQLKGEVENYPLEKEMPLEVYQKERNKLFDRFKLGTYLYDLAVQRFIIEGEYKNEISPQIHYYLGVLNSNYVFDGTYEDDKPIYKSDEFGNELITFLQMDKLTNEFQPKIKEDAEKLIKNITNANAEPCPLSEACGYKKQTMCKYFKEVCGKKIPLKNSSLNYVNNACGFLKEDGRRIKGLELINENILDMLDVDESWITRKNHFIQRKCYKNHIQYVNKEKIKKGLEALQYPIYHLDFETFPCPIPRFKGENPYIQSPFEFSLHIERAPGVCDKQKDNIIFLATTMKDEREELIKTLLANIDPDKGTLLAQNVAFEKGRIKELAHIFSSYQELLMKIYERGFDLLWLINNNKALYQELGFEGEDLETFNFYDEKLSGSFSIKKTLPLFSQLTYENLVVKNGTEAIVEYANYNKMSQEEFALKYVALRIYCQQDTWAMVEILEGLRKLII